MAPTASPRIAASASAAQHNLPPHGVGHGLQVALGMRITAGAVVDLSKVNLPVRAQCTQLSLPSAWDPAQNRSRRIRRRLWP
jgi:hypothetical protein